MIEALADGAVKEGMPRDLAYQLAAQTVLGAGHLVMETGQHPAKLRDDVTSPAGAFSCVRKQSGACDVPAQSPQSACFYLAGSTAAGLAHLEKCAVRSAMAGAVAAATRRCKEMQNQSK